MLCSIRCSRIIGALITNPYWCINRLVACILHVTPKHLCFETKSNIAIFLTINNSIIYFHSGKFSFMLCLLSVRSERRYIVNVVVTRGVFVSWCYAICRSSYKTLFVFNCVHSTPTQVRVY